MAQNSQRIFILVIVGVFLLSTIAFTGVIVYSIVGGDDNAQQISEFDEAQEAFEQADEFPDDQDSLEGTQLEGFEPLSGRVSELEIIDISEGDGAEVQPGATVVAHYTGAIARTGVIFQSSFDTGQPIPFGLDQVIQGWTEGVPGMKEGGERRLIIPAEKAYGEAGSPPNIGPDEDLVFDIVLVGIE